MLLRLNGSTCFLTPSFQFQDTGIPWSRTTPYSWSHGDNDW